MPSTPPGRDFFLHCWLNSLCFTVFSVRYSFAFFRFSLFSIENHFVYYFFDIFNAGAVVDDRKGIHTELRQFPPALAPRYPEIKLGVDTYINKT